MAGGTAPAAVSETALARAIQYALSRWDTLTRYADDGRLAIDNNVAERALRGIAITRKNFLFLGSEAGGERAAVLYTVLESAKLNGLDPQAWLTDVISAWQPAIPTIASPNYCRGIGSPKSPILPPNHLLRSSADAYLEDNANHHTAADLQRP